MALQEVSQRPEPAVSADGHQEIPNSEACCGCGSVWGALGELGCL